jgi:1-acyl-sn-glycerol-3-phosphate acyltransferase
MVKGEIFQLNLREILRTKAPRLYKKIPGWAITLLARLVCEKELNAVLRGAAPLTGVLFMEKALRIFGVEVRLHGVENLPADGRRCIFASNHPLGGMDGICLSAALGKLYDGRIRYLVNDILYFIRPLQDIFVPINKHGSQAKEAVALMHEAFVSDNQIITFPAGLCSRKTGGVVRDPKWKKMFISKAVEYRRDVVPVYFDAKNSGLFYNVARLRTAWGLKMNLEMLLLPREMFKKRNTVMNIYFGEPMAWQTFDTSKSPQRWALEIENKVYNMIK